MSAKPTREGRSRWLLSKLFGFFGFFLLLFVLCCCCRPCRGFRFCIWISCPLAEREREEIRFQYLKIPPGFFYFFVPLPSTRLGIQPVRKIELKGSTSVKKEEEENRRKRATKEDVSHSEGKKRRIRRETLLNYIAVAFERRVGPTFVPAVSGTPVASTNLPPPL